MSQRFAALGDEKRLLIVRELTLGDLAVEELALVVGMKGNLLAHHLGVLEVAGLIRRMNSEGDGRRRYVSLVWDNLASDFTLEPLTVECVAFVCTHNSARSQFAAAVWEATTGRVAISAGSDPAKTVHPYAVKVAAEFGVDISSATPGGYEKINTTPDLLVGVCDRAWEAGVPPAKRRLHWSVPDPVESNNPEGFRVAFTDLAGRIDRLAQRIAPTR